MPKLIKPTKGIRQRVGHGIIIVALIVSTTLGAAAAMLPNAWPDPGLLATVDSLSNELVEATSTGNFQERYPGLFPGFQWNRTVREIGSNGLFQVDYSLTGPHPVQGFSHRKLSILLFRPNSRPAAATKGIIAPEPVHLVKPGPSPRRPESMAVAESALERIESLVIGIRVFIANFSLYHFRAQATELSFVTLLPPDFPGSESFGGEGLRRVTLRVVEGERGRTKLIVEHVPVLLAQSAERGLVEPFRVELADDVTLLDISYWGGQGGWRDDWPYTNQFPRAFQITLGVGPPVGRARRPLDLASRVIAVPSVAVAPDIQGATFLPASENPPPSPVLKDPDFAPVAVPPLEFTPQRGEKLSGTSESEREISPSDLYWLGRSGVEVARWALGEEAKGHNAMVDSLRNKWAGGPGDLNGPLPAIDFRHIELTHPDGTSAGRITIETRDAERKSNINVADELMLQQAVTLVGADPDSLQSVPASILDWRDLDQTPRLYGAESDYYATLSPPYSCKNGPLDDLGELLRVKGLTPAIYDGFTGSVGLRHLFTPLSSLRVNINTAPPSVLQMIMPDLDSSMADAIARERSGPDGADGTEDDSPFRTTAELLIRVPQLQLLAQNPAFLQRLASTCTTSSLVFEIRVKIELDQKTASFEAIVRRNNPKEVFILGFSQVDEGGSTTSRRQR
jgi:general secretion pathway protein K